MYQSPTFRWTRKNNMPAHQLGTLSHRDQTNPMLVLTFREPDSMIFYFQLQSIRQETQTHPCLLGSGVPRHIIQRLLEDAVDMHSGTAIHREGLPLLLVGYGNSSLALYVRDVRVERAL